MRNKFVRREHFFAELAINFSGNMCFDWSIASSGAVFVTIFFEKALAD